MRYAYVATVVMGVAYIVAHIWAGVDILERTVHDFENLPVPQWTWPIWLVIALVTGFIAYVLFERATVRDYNARLKEMLETENAYRTAYEAAYRAAMREAEEARFDYRNDTWARDSKS